MSAVASPFAGFTGVGGGDPFGGLTSFGFAIPQGSPTELETASRTANECSFGLTLHGDGIAQGTHVAAAGWHGQAQAAFSGYAAHASSVLGTNAEAFAKAARALERLSGDLRRAQQLTRQAASDCALYEQQLTAAQQEADQHARDAQNLSQQAALAAHPHAQAQLNHQATLAAGKAHAAQGQANRARNQLESAQKQGRDADRAYEQRADLVKAQIQAAGEEIRIIPRLPGGAPIPIHITPADINLARRMLRGAGNLAAAANAAANPAPLRRLADGHLTPGAAAAFLRNLQIAEQNAAKPQQGTLLDAAGGFVNSATLGLLSFGNPHTARYRGGELAAMIPIDPEALAVDGERLAAKLAENGAKDAVEHAGAATVDPAKFSDYIFKQGADHGKDAIFRSYGYGPGDSQALAETYGAQAADKYSAGDYTLGKADQHGQRITIAIDLHGQGSAAGRSTIVKAGFVIEPNGSLRLVTPFAGFGK